MLILQFLFAIMIAFAVGKLIARLRLPSILGWLITGIVLGPHAFSLIDSELIGRSWYQITIHPWRYCACHSACTGTFHRK